MGTTRRRILLVGDAEGIRALTSSPKAPWGRGTEVVGALLTDRARVALPGDVEILGSVDDLGQVLARTVADEVISLRDLGGDRKWEEVAALVLERGVAFGILAETDALAATRPRVERLAGDLVLVTFQHARRAPLGMTVKRTIDIVGAFAGLIVTGIVWLWYAPRLRRESEGPVLFAQQRVGRAGRRFTLYKFRTMVPDAEEAQAALLPHNEMQGHVFKVRDDPRVTPTGRILREHHLDELPQFWNVLRGDMSLVGTRPPTVDEVKEYEPRHHRRLAMKPGITGLWQVQGNSSVRDFEEVVALDWRYIRQWSIWLDAKILVRTIGKMTRGGGW